MSSTEFNTGKKVEFNFEIYKLTFNPAAAIDEDPGEIAVEDLAEEGYQRPIPTPIRLRRLGLLHVLNDLSDSMNFFVDTKSSLAFVSSLGTGLMTAGFPFAGWLAERFGYQRTIICGLLFISFGLLLSSFTFSLWQVLITQGFVVGCGTCFVFYAATTITLPWFRQKRIIPTAAAATAIGLGGMTYALIAGAVNDPRILLRVNAAVIMLTFAATPFLKKRLPSLAREHVLGIHRLCDLRMLSLWVACFFASLAFLVPFHAFPIFSQNYTFSSPESAKLTASICCGIALGGASLSFISLYLGVLNVVTSSLLLGGIMCLTVWLFNTELAYLTAFCILHGTLSGAMLTLLPLIAFMFGAPSAIQTLGLLYYSNGIASMIGPPAISAFVELVPFKEPGHILSFLRFSLPH
ncbi:hypothetical protein L0F63_002835 [Massospora cicadina]|nr:hypothetical protein L0F63_002835 [Massospora cicadina]